MSTDKTDRAPALRMQGSKGEIAYIKQDGDGPGLVWFGGFRSDMRGSKATTMEAWALHHNHASLRFDYSGHGESEGKFENGTIGQWFADALTVFDAQTQGPQILVGSSMGAWIASLIAIERPDAIAAALFIAPAPDFTQRLMWPGFTDYEQKKLRQDGYLERPSAYSDKPEIVTMDLIEDGARHLILEKGVPIAGPVRILHGMQDEDVPWRHALKLADAVASEDVEIALVKSGDHRLSDPADLMRLQRALDELTLKSSN